jgi:hypothetical protein
MMKYELQMDMWQQITLLQAIMNSHNRDDVMMHCACTTLGNI